MSDFSQRLADALGSGFRVERELGGGGMSRVFLAEDVALTRKVVVKVLPPEMAASVNQDRFRREIQLAARLQHPHIVPLLSANAAGDLLWYVMPYIEGESLRAKLAREGELPVSEVVRLLREITDALAYAHEQGVVHRDIKPDNVMVSRGHALVTDFGVAKAVTASGQGSSLTSLGVALGTPAYMAPEQASADPHVDHRADLYALGVLAYEMLAGRPPFTAPSAQALLMAHVTQAPDPVSQHRPSCPPGLAAVVMRCLEKRAADRWQQAAEIIPHLDAALTPSGTQPTAAALPAADVGRALRRSHPVRVATLFAAASAVVLVLTFWLERTLGLPSWVLLVAAALLVVGFPVMLLTARRERARLEIAATGRYVPTPQGLRARLFTWRGAMGGGVLALGGLGLVAGAFMLLRATGVGPFATLVSAGILAERDRIILADFTNRTTDSTLGPSITEALRIDLTQSPVLRLVEGNEITAALQLMQRNPGVDLGEGLATEVAARLGAKAIVVGDVAPLGSGYVLSARVVGVADSTTLIADRETAADAGALIAAVEALSRRLRERIGESLVTVRESPPLERVTTTSLPALQAYSEGARRYISGRGGQAMPFLEQAVGLDSSFGMAWRLIGVLYRNQNAPGRAIDAMRRAYAHREQMPPQEAAHVTAMYREIVENNPAAAVEAYERLLASWSDDVRALNNLGVQYGVLQRERDAARQYRRALELQPNTALYLANLLQSLVRVGDFSAADSLLTDWWKADSTQGRIWYYRVRTAAEHGDLDRAYAIADSASIRRPQFRRSATWDLLLRQGRLREATPLFSPAEAALAEGILRGNLDRARQAFTKLDATIRWDSLPVSDRPYGPTALAWTVLGDLDRAETLLSRQAREVQREVLVRDPERGQAVALVALMRGRPQEALDGLRQVRCDFCTAFHEGQAFEALGQPDSAIAQYERYANSHNTDPENREWFLAAALRRLGEMHESKGERKKAVEYYGRFVDLWKDADAEFQPLVADIRRQIAALSAEPPRR